MLAVVPEQIAHKDRREIDARPGSGPTRADGSHGWRPELAINEEPVAAGVDKVRSHKSKCDGTNHVHPLHASPHGKIKQQRQRAPGHRFGIGDRESDDVRRDARIAKQGIKEPDGRHEERCEGQTEVDAVHERAMAILALPGSKGLRNNSVETDEKSTAEEGKNVNENAA